MNLKVIAVGGSLLGLAVGSVAGYFVAKNRYEQYYADLADSEIADAKRYFSMLYKEGEFKTPGAVLQQRRRPRTPEGFEHETPEQVELNANRGAAIFAETLAQNRYGAPAGEETQTEEELREISRSKGEPYILDHDEFMNAEVGYTQVTLTYFAGDDVLSDENDMPVEDVDATVGNANLDRFGHRSNDPKVVYIRNDKLEIDYEVCKSEGTYAQEVGGFDPAEDEPRQRKMPRE